MVEGVDHSIFTRNVEKLEGKSGRNTSELGANWGRYQKAPHRKLFLREKYVQHRKMDAYCIHMYLANALNIHILCLFDLNDIYAMYSGPAGMQYPASDTNVETYYVECIL